MAGEVTVVVTSLSRLGLLARRIGPPYIHAQLHTLRMSGMWIERGTRSVGQLAKHCAHARLLSTTLMRRQRRSGAAALRVALPTGARQPGFALSTF